MYVCMHVCMYYILYTISCNSMHVALYTLTSMFGLPAQEQAIGVATSPARKMLIEMPSGRWESPVMPFI